MFKTDSNTEVPGTIRIGVSSCLLGKKVRFDGGHKRSRFVTDALSDYFELVPYCPEVAIGMGIPRQPIRLVGDQDNPQAVGVKNPELNVTQPLRDYAYKVAGTIDGLCGFILKKDSPSCGMTRVKVYNSKGMPERSGTGLFAREIMQADPLLPVEEEGRLNDAGLCDSFITRVYAYARWKALLQSGLSVSRLMEFHASYKFLVMAHSNVVYGQLGRMLSGLSIDNLHETAASYIGILLEALKRPATRKQHTNVLQHLLGYLKKDLESPHRADLAGTIDAYRRGDYPLVVPVRLLQHYFRIHLHPYISRQVYLDPYPESLQLRNVL